MCRLRLACRFLIRFALPPRSPISLLAPSCVSCLCSPIRLLISSCVPHRAYLVGMSVSSRPLISSCLLSLRPLASLCLFAPLLVSPGGASSSRFHLVMRFACRPCVLAYRPSFRSLSGCGCGCHRFAHAFRCYRAASAPSRLCGRVLLSACLCYTVCRGDGDHRIRGIRARSHKPPQLTGGGVVVVFQFS